MHRLIRIVTTMTVTALALAGLALTVAPPAQAGSQPAPAWGTSTGAIRITEWMYQGANGEFIELTNVDDEPVNMADWSYDDDSQNPGVFDLSGFGILQPGESVVFTEGNPETFRAAWNLCDGVKLLGPYSNNLGRNDEINIYDAEDDLVDRLTYGDQNFPGSIRTQTRSGWVLEAGLGANDVYEWTLSSVGDAEGSYAAAGGDIGSPGKSARASAPFDPCESGGGPVVSIDQAVVIGSIGDPTNPAALLTLDHPVLDPEDLAVTIETTNAGVLPAGNVTLSGTGAERIVSFEPAGRGTSAVTFIVTDPDENEASVTITYAASNQAPDDSGRYHHHISDASSALDVGDGYMLLVNDETNTVFLHHQEISGLPVKTWTFSPGELGTSSEIDFESIARLGDLVVLSGSHGNNRSGEFRPERRTFVGATISGSGADTELAFLGRYNGLWADLRTWDDTDGHGLGADALGFISATANGVEPNPPNGFNIEALEFAPDAETLYLGFRAPTIEIEGTHHALIVPALNVDDVVDGAPAAGPAEFGAPIFLDLDGRSIRELRRNDDFEYLISAGPSPQNGTWALYTWDGDPGHQPQFNRELPQPDFLTGGVWESIVAVPPGLEAGASVRLVTDSGDTNFYGTGQTKDLPQPFQKSYSQLFALENVGGGTSPQIDVVPDTLSAIVQPGGAATKPLTVSNLGDSLLEWEIAGKNFTRDSGWKAQDSGTMNDLRSVSIATPAISTVVGNGGIILRTENGGQTWEIQDSGTTATLRGVSMTTASVGTVVGHNGSILRSENSGQTWESQNSGVTTTLAGISMTTADIGTVVGSGGIILRTENGGQTWETQDSGTMANLRGVSMTTAGVGMAVGGDGIILRTEDGGGTWQLQDSGTTAVLNGVSMATANVGTVVGNDGIILRTEDGGGTWQLQDSGTTTALFGVSMATANVGTVVGNDGSIIRTEDGGVTWIKEEGGPPLGSRLYAVALFNSETGWTVGANGFIFRRGGVDPGGDCILPEWLDADPSSGSVPGGEAQLVDVHFDASELTLGDYDATLCLASNDPDNPVVEVPVSLTVQPETVPELLIYPQSLDFGDVVVGTTSEPLIVTLENAGAVDATDLSFSTPGNGFEADTSDCGTVLPAGEDCTISVTFNPGETGAITVLLEIESAENVGAELVLSGEGVGPAAPAIAVDPPALDAAVVQGQSGVLTLDIANIGYAVLNWGVIEELSALTRVAAVTMNQGETTLLSAVIDPLDEFAYFGTHLNPGTIVKVDLLNLERINAATLDSEEAIPQAGVIDPEGTFAYFGTANNPARVAKIDLGSFERVDGIVFESGESSIDSAVIDSTATFAYFGTASFPARVVKVDLAGFERIDSIVLQSDENWAGTMVIDPEGDFAYVGTVTAPGRIVKLDLQTFERIGAIELAAGEDFLWNVGAMDPGGSFAYFVTGTVPARIVKIDLASFTRVAALELDGLDGIVVSGQMDPAGSLLYLATNTTPSRVVAIDLESFEWVDELEMLQDEGGGPMVIDSSGRFAYLAVTAGGDPGRIVQISLRSDACALPEWLSADPSSGSVPGGEVQLVDVHFDASELTLGDYDATLCLASNDPDNPVVEVPVSLTVQPETVPELLIYPEQLDFGEVEVDTSSGPLDVTLTSTGSAPVEVSAIDAAATPFQSTGGDCPPVPFDLAPTESCTLAYTFTPTTAGSFSQALTIASTADPASFTLAGEGVEPLLPVAAITPDEFHFVADAGGAVGDVLNVGNDGQAPLTWNIVTDQPAAGLRDHDPALDEAFVLPGFTLVSQANGGSPAVFTVSGGALTRGEVIGFSFAGTVSGITGNDSWAADTCMIIEAPDGTTYGVGGFTGTQAGCNVNAWDFDGEQSSGDGFYESTHDGVFDPVLNDLGEWTITFVNDWNDAAAAAITWNDVTVTLYKTPWPFCDDPDQVDWLEVDPDGGVTPPGDSDEIAVLVDTAGLMPGNHFAALCVATDDPDAALVTVPVALTVIDPTLGVLEGTVTTPGYCGTDPGPVAGAAVTVAGQEGTYETTADGDGFYSIELSADENPLQLTAGAAGYLDGVADVVEIVVGESTTADLELLLNAPCVAVEPDSISASVAEGGTGSAILTVGNLDGVSDLEWNIETVDPSGGLPTTVDDYADIPVTGAFVRRSGARTGGTGNLLVLGDVQMSQTADTNIVESNSVACDGGPNHLLRRFYFEEHPGVGNPTNISSVDIAIQEGVASQTLTVMLYTLPRSTPVDTIPLGALELIGSGTAAISQTDDLTVVNVPVSATVSDTGAFDLVVEVMVSGVFFIGSTDSGETHPGFILAPACGATTPTRIDTLGANFENTHIIMVVNAAPPGECDQPSAIPWLSVDPGSGATQAGQETGVEVLFDAAELPQDDYKARLCIHSNDPFNPTLAVPVNLTVTERPSGVLALAPSELDFGDVETGAAVSLSFTVSNAADAGAQSLELAALDASGDGVFAVTGGDCIVGGLVEPGESCDVEVTFGPDVEGAFGAAVTVETVDGQSAVGQVAGSGFDPVPPPDEIHRDRFEQ